MAHLAQHECDIIEQNPLGDSLDAIREALREAEPHITTDTSHADDSADVPARPRLFMAAIAKLFGSLNASEVSLSLDSRTGRESLLYDLSFVRSRLQKGEILYKHCRPLSELVVQKASDVEIWGSVIILIQAVLHCTPPPSPPSFETPITHSSASQQGSEQTRRAIEPRVFEEIHHCTHHAVNDGTSLVQHDQTPYANRIFRILAVSPAGRPISQFESVVEMLECLHDAIKAHQILLSKGKILYGEVSENNIIITDPAKADGFSGMLIDLDLAKEEGTGSSEARHRTGTMEFMAIEVLLGYSHTYRHDLEAFFYVLIWLCARRAWKLSSEPGKQPRKSMLLNWYTGDYQEIAHAKVGHITKTEHLGLRLILKEFPPEFDCVKPLCWELRDILFLCEDEFFSGTPKESDMLYEPMLRAFKKAIAQVKAVVE